MSIDPETGTPMTPPDSGEPNLPCPHGRSSWHHCPHCLGLNAPIPASTRALAAEQTAIVVLDQALAQRILAALAFDVSHESLAAELRAIVERKT